MFMSGGFIAPITNNFTPSIVVPNTKIPGIDWAIRKSPVDNNWSKVIYANGAFVAIANSGTDNRIMTSYDGIEWDIRVSPSNANWTSICYSNDLKMFAATASGGTGHRIMTSRDGINWTSYSTGSGVAWSGIVYDNNNKRFIAYNSATASSGETVRSSDGITWNLAGMVSGSRQGRKFLAYVNNLLFSTTINSTTGVYTMYSSNDGGSTWNYVPLSLNTINLRSIAYGNGLYVATLSGAVSGSYIITSPNAKDWTFHQTPINKVWTSVCYSNDLKLFVAVSSSGVGNRVITSQNGIDWTLQSSPVDNSWQSVCYGNGRFVAVANSGTGNRIMTSP